MTKKQEQEIAEIRLNAKKLIKEAKLRAPDSGCNHLCARANPFCGCRFINRKVDEVRYRDQRGKEPTSRLGKQFKTLKEQSKK